MPVWPAEQIPELYPPGTAKKVANEIESIVKTINDTLKSIPKDSSLKTKQEVLDKNLWEYGASAHIGNNNNLYVFIASDIAPELDQYIDIN